MTASNTPGNYQLLLDIPGNVIATVMLPAAGLTNPVALVDGVVVSGLVSNNWLMVTNVLPGQHAIWLSTNNVVSTATLYDNWAAGWFGGGGNAAPNADPDGDGVSNYNEFVAGTNPLDAADKFQIVGVNPPSGQTPVTVTIKGSLGRHYTLQRTASLSPVSWQAVDALSATTDGQIITLKDTGNSGVFQAFLRVLVSYR